MHRPVRILQLEPPDVPKFWGRVELSVAYAETELNMPAKLLDSTSKGAQP
jgi:hypothetical protein